MTVPEYGGVARKLLFLLPAAVFAVLIIAFAMGLHHDPSLLPSALINRPAPNFDLPSLYDPGKRQIGRAHV